MLPAEQRRKPVEIIASKKRSMYRKRYAWLDALEARVGRSLSEGAESDAFRGAGTAIDLAAKTPEVDRSVAL